MCYILPIDDNCRSISSRARAIVHYRFNPEHWEYREDTGRDVGTDCRIELTENEQWSGNILYCQIKGRTNPEYNIDMRFISINMLVSTINYALAQASSYVLLVVDVRDENVYYLPIQEYFIANPSKFDKLNGGQTSITIRVPTDNIVCNDDNNLQEIARSRYVGGPGRELHRAT